MPIKNKLSRHVFAFGHRRTDEKILLEDRVPYRYEARKDNIVHVVAEGDSLWTIAAKYYAAMSTVDSPASSLWWIIADFQDPPIIDPTIRLAIASKVIVPSRHTVTTRVFDERRRSGLVLY